VHLNPLLLLPTR